MTSPSHSIPSAAHKPTPVYEMRGLPGSSSGFQIGYWCRITKDDDGNSMKVHYVPDPKGEFFIVVAEIPGMGKAHENREQAAFIVRACNAYDSDQRKIAALVASIEEMIPMVQISPTGTNGMMAILKARAALAKEGRA